MSLQAEPVTIYTVHLPRGRVDTTSTMAAEAFARDDIPVTATTYGGGRR